MVVKQGCLACIVEDPQKLFGIIITFLIMLSGAIVLCVGLFSSATADIMPVWCYRVIFVVVAALFFALGISFWVCEVGPYIKEGLK
jgi:hypothetical protein